MPIHSNELMKALEIVASQEKLYSTVQSSVRGGVIAGISTMAGGILLGPIGLAIGGALGGVIACSSSDNFKPLAEIIKKDITPAQREALYYHILNGFNDFDIQDVLEISRLIIQGGSAYQLALELLKSYFESNIQMKITARQ